MNVTGRVSGLFVLALALAGCRSATMWADLHAPVEWRLSDAAPVEVVTSERTAQIVVADTPACKWAARFLADTIGEMTGSRPLVYVDCPERRKTLKEGLFIGAVRENAGWSCELGGDGREAFRVVAGDGCVRFLGRADFAVFDWCERELGMRYYGPDWKCVDRKEEIVVRPVDYSDRPTFPYRELWGGDGAWARVAKCGHAHRGGVSVHQPSGWIKDGKLRSEMPWIFENGETPMLCYGNPGTLDYYKRRIDRHIAGEEDSGGIVDTRRKVVTVCQWDAPIACKCEHCRGLYDASLGRSGNASPIIWGRFLKGLSSWLREAHPDYMISFLPYLNTCAVPRKRIGNWGLGIGGLETFGKRRSGPRQGRRRSRAGNVEAEVCTMSGLGLMKDPACRKREESLLRDWRRSTGRKVLNWNYGCWPQEWTSAPYVFGRTIQSHYEEMEDDLCGAYVCGGATDARLQLSMYVWMRCLWNPRVDVGAIYDGFARRMFGPAAEPMRELIALQETCWNRRWEDETCSHRNVFEVSYPRADVERMAGLLQAAERMATAAGDVRAVERVRDYASGFATFKAESDALAARSGRMTVWPGATNEMVNARWVWDPRPWAKTEVSTEVKDRALVIRVVCAEPAAGTMDFTRLVNDFLWGNDRVSFVMADGGTVRMAAVDLTGAVTGGWTGFSATVGHDDRSWTVTARIALPASVRNAGMLLGNVCRWRIGDWREPKERRVAGSRCEHSRLGTCYTNLDADPAAFVEFRLASEGAR